MSAGPKSPSEDDETTSAREPFPRAPGRAPKPTRRGVDAPGMTAAGHGDDPDESLTMIDPEVPTGARGRPDRFDPHARADDNRKTIQRPATPLPFPEPEDDDAPPGSTVVGKRSAIPGAPGLVGPRIDDSTRTTRWEAPPVDEDAIATPQVPRAPVLPLAPGPKSEPLRVVSMRTPAEIEAEKRARPLPEVRLRPMADVHQTPPRGMGFLAPPHDPREARSRRRRDNVIWGSVAVIVAAVVMLAVWFLAR